MIVGWSPLTGVDEDSSPAKAVGYMMNSVVLKKVGSSYVQLRRNPKPELLVGRPSLMLPVLEAVPYRHRYTAATLSFTDTDVCVDDFNGGDPGLRTRVAQTVGLFLNVAYAGLPVAAPLHPLVGTHTHTGRLEVNILMPRAVWTSAVGLKAYNAHPPGRVSRALWDSFQDTVNGRFGWADPLDRMRRKMTKSPNWLIKNQREADRHGRRYGIATFDEIACLAESVQQEEGFCDRADLLDAMQPELARRGIEVVRLTDDTVIFGEINGNERWTMGGLLFSDAFRGDNPLVNLPPNEFDGYRAMQLRNAPAKLAEAMRRRADFNTSRYGYPAADAESLVHVSPIPKIEFPLHHPDHQGGSLVHDAQPARTEAHTADRADPRAGKLSHHGSGSPSGAPGAGARGDDRHARLLRHASDAASLFGSLKQHLSQIIFHWRRRQANVTLARAIGGRFTARFDQIVDSLERLNDRHSATARLAEASGRVAQADRPDRAAPGHLGPGRDAGPVGPHRPVPHGDHPRGGSDDEGRHRDGGRAGDPRPDQAHRSGIGSPGPGYRDLEDRDRADPDDAGRAVTAGDNAPVTRAALIRRVRQIAAEQNIASPRLTFVMDGRHEWLRSDTGSEVFFMDGREDRDVPVDNTSDTEIDFP